MRRSFLTRLSPFRGLAAHPFGKGLESQKDFRIFTEGCPTSLKQCSSTDESLFGPLTVYRHRAMACDFEISLNESDSSREEVFDVFDLIDQEETVLSVFRPTSLLSRINMLAAEMNVQVPSKLFKQLQICRSLWKETDGAFDITSSTLWKLWGFAKGEGRVPTEFEINSTLKNVGMKHVLLNEKDHTVAFDHPGVEINFGAIGKGFALDIASSFLATSSLEN